jgi:predicted acyl esterase
MRVNALGLVLLVAPYLLGGCGPQEDTSHPNWWYKSSYIFKPNIYVTSFDGTSLAAQAYQPKERFFPGPRPAVIFVNSWTQGEGQYAPVARDFAEKGYIILSYATRGFGRSGGVASGAGPKDIKDVSVMIDWLMSHTRVDPERIGMVGVSYGGGISLLGLAHDERLFTAAALSGWANLEKALYGNNTMRKLWLSILIGSGVASGRIDPKLYKLFRNLDEQTNIAESREWARVRSAINVVDKINQNGSPVFLANSYRDFLFSPNQALEFFEKLTTPKRMIMNRGIHASAEFSGLFFWKNKIWQQVHKWFDRWLLQPARTSSQRFALDVNQRYSLENGTKHEYYPDLPRARNHRHEFDMAPVNPVKSSDEAFGFRSEATGIFIESARDSGASTGIPIVSSLLDSYTSMKVQKRLSNINLNYGAVYYSKPFDRQVFIRGVPQVNFSIVPMTPDIQLVAYLYEVGDRGIGTLISHDVITYRNRSVGEKIDVRLNLNAISYDLKRGNKLAIVIDTFDALYSRSFAKNFAFQIIHDDLNQIQLRIPEP